MSASAAIADSPVQRLRAQAAPLPQLANAYAGEVTPLQAWEFLVANPDAVLVDVRTVPEWQFTGQPDPQGRFTLLSIGWKLYPQMNVNPEFARDLRAAGATEATPLFFICRTGGRSLDAAIAMTEAGFRHCFNVSEGFEGEANEAGHRGERFGWKASRLPWRQA